MKTLIRNHARVWGLAVWLAAGLAAAAADESRLSVRETAFGTLPDGTAVKLFTLRNGHGLTLKISSYGAMITELQVPDRAGQLTNVVLGYDQLDRYVRGVPAAAATIGRFANRIAKARFTLDGIEYRLAANSGQHHIHGGRRGFDKAVWTARALPVTDREAGVELRYLSKDGEEGYPGNLEVMVTFTLTADDEVRITYRATTDKATPINLTNHGYFNLAGWGDVLGHELMIAADRYTLADAALIPTGELAPVKGTPLDFTQPMAIGARIEQLKPRPGGYDHNYVLNGGGQALALAARLLEPKSGRTMQVLTTQPGMQLYTGNHLDGRSEGVGGVKYVRHGGVCFETQHYPDSVNHSNFPSAILRPGEQFRSITAFRFAAK